MLFMILLGVAVVIFCVLAFLATRGWLIGHVLILVGIFLFTLGLMVLSGMVLKTQSAWNKLHGDLTKQLETTQTQLAEINQRVVIGSDGDRISNPELAQRLHRVLLNRGRVWRNTALAGGNESELTLNMVGWGDSACVAIRGGDEDDSEGESDGAVTEPAPAEEGATETAPEEVEEGAPVPVAAAPNPHGITANLVLYAFLELPPPKDAAAFLFGSADQAVRDRKGACRLPGFYLGRFGVKAVNETTITIQPLDPLSDKQRQAFQERTTWVLYESLPKDEYSVFAGIQEAELMALRPAWLPEEAWIATVKDILADGQPAMEGEQDERKWVKIRFTKAVTIPVDVEGGAVEGENAAAAESSADRAFDPSGRAAYISLQQGKPTEFAEGTEAVFDGVTAKRLIADGEAEALDEPPLYRRELRDYEGVLSTLYAQLDSIQQRIEVEKQAVARIVASTESAQEQTRKGGVELLALEADRRQFTQERDHISQVTSTMEERRENQRRALSRLYQANLNMRRELLGTAPVISIGP